jgi:hypothetical protein
VAVGATGLDTRVVKSRACKFGVIWHGGGRHAGALPDVAALATQSALIDVGCTRWRNGVERGLSHGVFSRVLIAMAIRTQQARFCVSVNIVEATYNRVITGLVACNTNNFVSDRNMVERQIGSCKTIAGGVA